MLLLLLCAFEKNVAAQPAGYPERLTYNSAAFQKFKAALEAMKKRTGCVYRTETLDSVGCTVAQLSGLQKPVRLTLDTAKQIDTEVLKALRKLLDENKGIFHTDSRDVALVSMQDYGDVYDVVFERGYYKKFKAAGQTRGAIEFIVSKQGDIGLIACTVTRPSTVLPDAATYPPDKLAKSLLGRKMSLTLAGQNITFVVDRSDYIKVGKVCVYEKKVFDDRFDSAGELTERRLRSSEVHLAYEILITADTSDSANPVATVFFDALTGKELETEYPVKK